MVHLSGDVFLSGCHDQFLQDFPPRRTTPLLDRSPCKYIPVPQQHCNHVEGSHFHKWQDLLQRFEVGPEASMEHAPTNVLSRAQASGMLGAILSKMLVCAFTGPGAAYEAHCLDSAISTFSPTTKATLPPPLCIMLSIGFGKSVKRAFILRACALSGII